MFFWGAPGVPFFSFLNIFYDGTFFNSSSRLVATFGINNIKIITYYYIEFVTYIYVREIKRLLPTLHYIYWIFIISSTIYMLWIGIFRINIFVHKINLTKVTFTIYMLLIDLSNCISTMSRHLKKKSLIFDDDYYYFLPYLF